MKYRKILLFQTRWGFTKKTKESKDKFKKKVHEKDLKNHTKYGERLIGNIFLINNVKSIIK